MSSQYNMREFFLNGLISGSESGRYNLDNIVGTFNTAAVCFKTYFITLTPKYLLLSRVISCSCIGLMDLLTHHHPDWLVQITVARDTFGALGPAVIAVDVVV